MRKILMCAALTVALIACKKDTTQTVEKKERTMFIRVEEVDNDGQTTISPVVFVKVKE